jgi:glutamate racemase
VLKALRKLLPRERTLYFGDTARVPYGTKSPETVRRYAVEVARFLDAQGIKALVVACNTASSVALREVRRAVSVPVVGVLEPGVEAALRATRTGRIGIVGTASTVESRAYERALRRRRPGVRCVARACPLFVPLAEEGWGARAVTRAVAGEYLAPLKRARVDTLILGCTHYPLLRSAVARVMGSGVVLVDSASTTAKAVRALLAARGLSRGGQACPAGRRAGALSPRGGHAGGRDSSSQARYFVSDDPRHFRRLAERFLGRAVRRVRRVALRP